MAVRNLRFKKNKALNHYVVITDDDKNASTWRTKANKQKPHFVVKEYIFQGNSGP